jgi:hypothetical protein
MAKRKTSKKAAAKDTAGKKERKKRTGTCIEFLRELYGKDPNISNEKALSLLLKKFTESNAKGSSITTWKNMLRAEGMDIPKLKAGARKKKGDDKKKAKKKVRRRKH